MRIPLAVRTAAIAVVVSLTGSAAAVTGFHGRDWTGSWSTAVTRGEPTGLTFTGLTDTTVRSVIRPSVGGDKLRIRLTNIYGEKAVRVGAATVAKPDASTPSRTDLDPSTSRTVTFGGATSAVMNRGGELLSDPVDLRTDDVSELVVSLYFPENTGPTTWHANAVGDTYFGPANLVNDTAGAGYVTTRRCCFFFLSGVDVLTSKSAGGSVVVLGDSIADGTASTANANNRWPDQLAERLAAKGRPVGVLNAGLAGNRLNFEGPEPGAGGFPGFQQLGVNALARLNEDVFAQTDAETVITHLGINDIWMKGESADRIIASLRQLNAQAKERDLRSVVGTITPFEGLAGEGVWTPEKEATRQAVNTYLRSSREFDGLIDFDKVVRDPAQPSRLLPAYDSGDHIHLNDAGYQAMADAVPLSLVR